MADDVEALKAQNLVMRTTLTLLADRCDALDVVEGSEVAGIARDALEGLAEVPEYAVTFARQTAESCPMDGGDSYGDPCCSQCAENWRNDYSADRFVLHRPDCAWVKLRRAFKLDVPCVINSSRHAVQGEDD